MEQVVDFVNRTPSDDDARRAEQKTRAIMPSNRSVQTCDRSHHGRCRIKKVHSYGSVGAAHLPMSQRHRARLDNQADALKKHQETLIAKSAPSRKEFALAALKIRRGNAAARPAASRRELRTAWTAWGGCGRVNDRAGLDRACSAMPSRGEAAADRRRTDVTAAPRLPGSFRPPKAHAAPSPAASLSACSATGRNRQYLGA